jgi:hypothetical protein
MTDEEKVAKLIQLLSDKYSDASMNFWRFIEQHKAVDTKLKELCTQYEQHNTNIDETFSEMQKAEQEKEAALKEPDEDIRFVFEIIAELDIQNAASKTQVFIDSYKAIEDYCCLIGGGELVMRRREEAELYRQHCYKIIDGENLETLLGELGCTN